MGFPTLNEEAKEVRADFVRMVNGLPWNNRLRTDSETLLIIYDQLVDRYETDQELIIALKQYVELLSAELGELVTLAHNHGWKSQYIQEGIELRAKIEKLSSKPKPDPESSEQTTLF